MKFEYVLSALRMMRIDYIKEPETIAIIQEFLQTQDGELSFLFNAFVEKEFGKILENRNFQGNESGGRIFVDSGGLQVTTLGLDAKEVKKKQEEIYITQGSYSAIAMNFDEMAVRKSEGDDAGFVNASKRLFIEEDCIPAARRTIPNIKRQIEVFDSLESDTKIMLIAQGNCLSTYNEYLSTIIKGLSDYEISRLYGVAPSSASIGNGQIQIYDLLYATREFDIPERLKENIHLLGVGSSAQMTPLMYSKEYFSYINTLSFDSTSASRRYLLDGYVTGTTDKDRMPKDKYNIKDIIAEYNLVYERFKPFIDKHPKWKGVEDFVMNQTYYAPHNKKGIWGYLEDRDFGSFFIFFIIMGYVMNTLNELRNPDPKKGMILEDIKCYDDYIRLKPHLAIYYGLRDNKVSKVKTQECFDKKQNKIL